MGTLLRHMTRRLVQNRDFEGVIQTILDDAVALLGAEYGNVQLPIGEELAIAVQRGLSADFLKTFWRVKKNDGSACGRALSLGVTVIIPDIEKDADFAVFRQDARHAGFRAVQSTPMVKKDGTLLGIVSTHFSNVHEPTLIEMNTLKASASSLPNTLTWCSTRTTHPSRVDGFRGPRKFGDIVRAARLSGKLFPYGWQKTVFPHDGW